MIKPVNQHHNNVSPLSLSKKIFISFLALSIITAFVLAIVYQTDKSFYKNFGPRRLSIPIGLGISIIPLAAMIFITTQCFRTAPMPSIGATKIHLESVKKYLNKVLIYSDQPSWQIEPAGKRNYKIVVQGEGYYSKLFSIFMFLKKAGVIDENVLFKLDSAKKYLVCSPLDLQKMALLCENEMTLRAMLPDIFEDLQEENDTISVLTASAPSYTDVRVTCTASARSQLQLEDSILYFPGFVQMKTTNLHLEQLLQRYYEECGFLSGIFDNTSFEKLRAKLELLYFIKDTDQLSASQAIELGLQEDQLTKRLSILTATQILQIADPERASHSDKLRLLTNSQKLTDAATLQNLATQSALSWDTALDIGNQLGTRAFFLVESTIDQDTIDQLIYQSKRKSRLSHSARFNIILNKVRGCEEITKQFKNLGNSWDDFARDFETHLKIADDTVMEGYLHQIETIAFYLLTNSTSEESIQNFCTQWNAITWGGCQSGYRGKLASLLSCFYTKSFAQMLQQSREELLNRYIAHALGDKDEESIMYHGALRYKLGRELGLPIPEGWHSSHYGNVDEARNFIMMYYTPSFVFHVVFDEVQQQIKERATNISSLTEYLISLGISNLEIQQKYCDPHFAYTMNMEKLQFELRTIVLNVCLQKGFLEPL